MCEHDLLTFQLERNTTVPPAPFLAPLPCLTHASPGLAAPHPRSVRPGLRERLPLSSRCGRPEAGRGAASQRPVLRRASPERRSRPASAPGPGPGCFTSVRTPLSSRSGAWARAAARKRFSPLALCCHAAAPTSRRQRRLDFKSRHRGGLLAGDTCAPARLEHAAVTSSLAHLLIAGPRLAALHSTAR